MKYNTHLLKALMIILLGSTLMFSSCNNDKYENKKGFVTFGANYHIINCITTVSIFIDGEYIGKLEDFTNEITDCGLPENITEEVLIGDHTYKIEIRELEGGCIKDLEGTFTIIENKCEKIFIDYSKITF